MCVPYRAVACTNAELGHRVSQNCLGYQIVLFRNKLASLSTPSVGVIFNDLFLNCKKHEKSENRVLFRINL